MGTFEDLRALGRFFVSHPLTCDFPLGAWARFASWQFRSRLQNEILINWIEKQRLALRHGMTGATLNVYVGLHEFADMMVPLHFLRESELFIDIGANVGSYTVLASGVCRARTWAFEPDPDTVRHLKRNIEANRLEALVTVHECALGAEQGEVPFTVGLDTVNRIASANDKSVRIVPLKRLDAVIANSQPIMLKIDVEGAEGGVLQGATTLLATPCLKVIELETVTSESLGLLKASYFERAYYDPFNRRLNREPIAFKSSNSLFVRDWPFVQDRLATAKEVKIFGRRI